MPLESSTRRWRPWLLRPLLQRPYLVAAVVLGIVFYFALAPWVPRAVTRALIAWDGGVILFLCLALHFMSGVGVEQMKQRAVAHDEGGHLILILTILASVASLGALAAEIAAAKGDPSAGLRIVLAAGTIMLSWLFVQIAFAMHYAHIFYLAEASGQPKGGLEFGEEGEPDYWDFVHFSIVMGTTAQTADVAFSSRRMRRLGTLHTLIAFGFNTAILATMINLAAAYL